MIELFSSSIACMSSW